MRYFNPETKCTVELGGLSDAEEKFYLDAFERFKRNADWLSFEQFALDLKSPIFFRRRAHSDVLKDPLFLALKDMWLQLGIEQGMIARRPKAEAVAARRSHRVARRPSRLRRRSVKIAG